MATSAQRRQEIEQGRWDDLLCGLYGEREEVLARQRARWCAALTEFERYYGPGREVQLFSSPGRTELGGNHTDHQHGYGLAAAVGLDLVAVAAQNDDHYIRVKSWGFNKLDVVDLDKADLQSGEFTHSASLIRGLAEGFRSAGREVGGYDAYTTSDVLRGSGLSSSAAFEMGMGAIMNGEFGCGLTAAQVARLGQYAENIYFGKPSGMLDQLASALGAEKLMLLTDIEGLCNDIKLRDVISYLNIADVQGLKDQGTIAGGMIPKVDCCVQAIEEGVTNVHIIDGRKPHSVLYEAFTDEGIGTMLM